MKIHFEGFGSYPVDDVPAVLMAAFARDLEQKAREYGLRDVSVKVEASVDEWAVA